MKDNHRTSLMLPYMSIQSEYCVICKHYPCDIGKEYPRQKDNHIPRLNEVEIGSGKLGKNRE